MDHRISESANKVIPLFCPFSGDFLDDISDEQTDHAVVDLWQTDGDDTAAVNDENDDVFEEDDNCVKVKLCQDNEKIDLIDAAREACRSNSITPLLKQELKWLIQARRVEQGMDEMTVQFQTPAVAQLSTTDLERIERRKSQNRMAARRFRQKRKMSEESMLKTIQQLQDQNQQLEMAAQHLRKEKQLLLDVITDHLVHCPCLTEVSLETLGGAAVS